MAKRKPTLSFGNKEVAKEAFEHKHGGAVGHKRMDRKAHGGAVSATKSPLAAHSSKHPWSSAKRG